MPKNIRKIPEIFYVTQYIVYIENYKLKLDVAVLLF